MKSQLLCLLVVMLFSPLSMAITSTTNEQQSHSKNINQNSTYPKQTEDQFILNKYQQDLEKASFWGLTIEEWNKFETIQETKGRKYWSPNLDPLTTLGVEAETKEERERYAMLLVKKEFERTTKELEFQRTYDRVFKKLYPDILPIEIDDNPNFVAPINFEGERLVLFIDINDSVSGNNLLSKAISTGMDLDVYLLNTSNDNEMIQKWAVLHNISIEQVRKGAITLNHDNGQWSQIGKGISPILLQQQNSKWRQIEIGE